MMSYLDRFQLGLDGPVEPEEDIERFLELYQEGVSSAGGSIWQQYGGWILFAGIVIGIVAFMFLMIAGRYRRERAAMEEETSPLFEDEFIVHEEAEPAPNDDRFSEVVIEGVETVDESTAIETVRSFESSDPYSEGETVQAHPAEDDGLSAFEVPAEPSIFDQEPVEIDTEDYAAEPEEPVEEYEAPAAPEESYEQYEAPKTPRYAFATGRTAMSTKTPKDPEPHLEDETPYSEPATAQDDTLASEVQGSDDHRPFVAPFIREDIQESERRQADRIDGLRDNMRDEFARQIAKLESEQASRLDLVVSAIDRKLEAKLERLSQRQADIVAAQPDHSQEVNRGVSSLSQQVDRLSSAIDGQGQRMRTITSVLETRFNEVGRIHDEVKTVYTELKSVRQDLGKATDAVSEVRGDLDAVKEHVGRLERAILDRAAQDNSTTVRLADVIRGTLPDGSYAFAATLANGETADCLINFDGLKQKIAIDAGFPMEAFNELPSRDAVRRNLPQAKGAEDAFRRAILRAILEAGDRCISPAETADSCMLFMPSEAAYTILHDRFPDLVRDSQRARVWLASPSTLMGTLTLIRNLIPETEDLSQRQEKVEEAAQREEEEKRLRDEVVALRRRASGLAEELDRTRGTLRNLIGGEALGEAPSTTPAPEPDPIVDIAPLREEPKVTLSAVEEIDDDGIIEGLRFEGTPEWEKPANSENDKRVASASGTTSLYDDDRADTLR